MFKKITLYVVRLSKTDDDTLKDSRPCIDCHKKLIQLGIKKIIYSTDNGIDGCKTIDYKPYKRSLGHRYINNGFTHSKDEEYNDGIT